MRRAAAQAEIRRAYLRQARQWHPALNPGDPVAAERFHAVADAFAVLSDPQRRARYDRGELRPAPAPTTPEVGFEGFDFSAEVRVRSASFREMFDTAMPENAAAPAPGSSAGESLEQTASVSFLESLTGTRRRVHLVRQDTCSACDGRGVVPRPPAACPHCGATGKLRGRRGHMIFARRCAECGGTGSIDTRGCARCGGDGRVAQSEWLDVEVPPGVADGSRVRVPGCGNVGLHGGPPGDFVLVVSVEPHPFYRRDANDLVCEVPITIFEAALGAHVEVPTPDGPLTIEVPAGTRAGQRFRMRKRGVPQPDGTRGDLYVEVRLEVPRVGDDRSRELLRELALRHPDRARTELLGTAAVEAH